jgi:crotonobetainyl-CoA:carnitine CoA-transferase CaiB-like acyl-CoA transferase
MAKVLGGLRVLEQGTFITGPAAGTYESVAQAASGFLGLLINPANPRVVGPAIADSLTGFMELQRLFGNGLTRDVLELRAP